MRLSMTRARPLLGELCLRAQDPRQTIILTRHGKPIAALVSMAEAKRIWNLQDEETHGRKNPLSGTRGDCLLPGFVTGLNGAPVTPSEAALQMREVQMRRAEERRVLAAGGLEPVEGGEVAVMRKTQRRWWRIWRRAEA